MYSLELLSESPFVGTSSTLPMGHWFRFLIIGIPHKMLPHSNSPHTKKQIASSSISFWICVCNSQCESIHSKDWAPKIFYFMFSAKVVNMTLKQCPWYDHMFSLKCFELSFSNFVTLAHGGISFILFFILQNYIVVSITNPISVYKTYNDTI